MNEGCLMRKLEENKNERLKKQFFDAIIIFYYFKSVVF